MSTGQAAPSTPSQNLFGYPDFFRVFVPASLGFSVGASDYLKKGVIIGGGGGSSGVSLACNDSLRREGDHLVDKETSEGSEGAWARATRTVNG